MSKSGERRIIAMKKARLLLPLLLLLVLPMTAQIEDAPKPAQCRADSDAWGVPKWTVFNPNVNQFADLADVMIHNQAVFAQHSKPEMPSLGNARNRTTRNQAATPKPPVPTPLRNWPAWGTSWSGTVYWDSSIRKMNKANAESGRGGALPC